ncbi:hypothetical protein BKH41_06200 [Helicobacter sp. 12S02232-10]|uniref:copper resistance outer membrane protein CrdB n=1 Tax=Helicobacter sp. 12S02232-10 TaxID=1476197 RepID=UPI000BA54E20|nr:copper resistance outer membrane protein CrdB [Helicobacter sp. 12S02232-10]PAF48303.1 hypothetical protein BKH41_06200 [Helicobacter sp. 12S02232-10]
MIYKIIIFLLLGASIHALDIQSVSQKYLRNNKKIQSLETQIKALEAQAKVAGKWEDPILSLGYNNANINNPFILNSSYMQNISVGLSQKIDLNGKKNTQSKIVDIQKQSKILELKKLKQQYAINIFISAINSYKNTQEMELLKNAIKNLQIVLNQAQGLSNPNTLSIAKLKILKAQLEIRKNNLENSLNDAKIAISELSFESLDFLSLAPKDVNLDANKEIEKVKETNYDIKIAMLQENGAKKELALAKKSLLGDVNLNISYFRRSDTFDMFAVGVAIPLPAYGKQTNLIEQKKQESLISKDGIEDARNRAIHTAMGLIKKIKTLQKNLEIINKDILGANAQIVQIYKENLPTSGADYASFYNALNDEINTELSKLEILSELNIAYLNLQNLKGLE